MRTRRGNYKPISKISQSTLLASTLVFTRLGKDEVWVGHGVFSFLVCDSVGAPNHISCQREDADEGRRPSLLIADVIGGGSIGQNNNADAPNGAAQCV